MSDISRPRATRNRADRATRNDVLPPPDPSKVVEDAVEESSDLERLPAWPEKTHTVEDIADAFEVTADALDKGVRSGRRKSLRLAIGWLCSFPGDDWDARWQASRIEEREDWSSEALAEWNMASGLSFSLGNATQGIGLMAALGVVRPSIAFLHREHVRLRGLPEYTLEYRDPDTRDEVIRVATEHAAPGIPQQRARAQAQQTLGQILAVTGKQRIADVTPDDLIAAREAAVGNREKKLTASAWDAMGWLGLLPENTPITYRSRQRMGQRSTEQMIDNTGIANTRMRNLFVAYVRERAYGMDYPSKVSLVQNLVTNFWCELERLFPGIDTFDLSPDEYDKWVEHMGTIHKGSKKGQPRKSVGAIVLVVRGFYFDINHWATADPERYGSFAARNPVGRDAIRMHSKNQKRQRSASHERTRERMPHLPTLMNKADDDRRWTAQALEAARAAKQGETFVVGGVELFRPEKGSAGFGVVKGGTVKHGGILLQRLDTGDYFDIVQRETTCFWRWAGFNVLKETGVRIEELEELTHTSLTQYRLQATGKLVPLLQIAPSKDDEERVLLVSPELANVLFAIISRVRNAETGRIPLVSRYDYHEKTNSEPMPFLFQRRYNGEDRLINRAWLLRQFGLAAAEAGIVDEAGEVIKFQNHDMRRIFATEALQAGLPPHILAKVYGHDNVDTTMGYAAIYPEEVFQRHRAFIDRRRQLRPSAEYREPTQEEVNDFLGHFERRKLALGSCGRGYGTKCAHEHACIRCSMLQLEPEEEQRIVEIAENLKARIAEAKRNNWLGEVEGLQISLDGANAKVATLRRRAETGPVSLGLPAVRTIDQSDGL